MLAVTAEQQAAAAMIDAARAVAANTPVQLAAAKQTETQATARFQAAFNRAVATRPYTAKISELVAELSRHAGDIDHPLLKINEGAGRSALLVLTSNRGLCGGYNANVLRTAMAHRKARQEASEQVDLHMVGRKGIGYLRFLRIEAVSR